MDESQKEELQKEELMSEDSLESAVYSEETPRVESLRKKTVKGVGWSFADNIANQGITFLVGLVLARLLTPSEYGLIGIIMIFIAVFNSIVDSGFSSALIRKKDLKKEDLSTVFVTNMGVSLLLMVVMFLCAVPIGRFFNSEELVGLTRVMSVIVVINALAIVQRTLLVIKIDFKTQTRISLIASISSGVVGIVMAFVGYGVWALVGQQLSRQILNTTFLWVWSRWRPSLVFSKSSFSSLFGFGWKLLLSGLIDTVWNEIYQVVIGKCYTPANLGQYTRAVQFSNLASSNITTIVQRVSYPALSRLQDEPERLREGYRKVIKVTMFGTFAVMLLLAACSKSLILTLIGEKWLMAVPMLQIICLSKMLYPLHAINLNMLQVKGRSDLFLKLEIFKKLIAVGPILVGIFVGIFWMLGASVLTGLIAYYLNAYYSGHMVGYSMKQQVLDILPGFLIALASACVAFSLVLLPINYLLMLPLQVVVGIACVCLISKLTKNKEYSEIKEILKGMLRKMSKK